ncbi:MAG: M61 family metallopeptidase [Acidobacteria bacterium]|nr:M61 family metallopeptidase [Acidobacteriota bacterium]
MPDPATHYFHVNLRIEGNTEQKLRLMLPVWTPGSYIVREYAKFVEDFSASATGGKTLAWKKNKKNTWEIDAGAAQQIEVHYLVYANILGVQSADLDDQHGYYNGAAIFMYTDAQKSQPFQIKIEPFGDWRVATSLQDRVGEGNSFTAPDYDTLIDCPVEVSRFVKLTVSVRNIPHYLIIHGPAKYDAEKLSDAVRRIVDSQAQMMGGLPYKQYAFLFHLGLPAGGGLEHFTSTSINSSLLSFRREDDWERFLDLISHEYFHHWNVKRIRPQALGPFDYTQENYTRALWVSEGVTDYYSLLTLARAGLITPKKYYKTMAKLIQDYREIPGRLKQSAEQSSFDAWIKGYRQTENSVNTEMSYYTKGGLLGLVLDMEIRTRTQNAKSMDDVMRALYENYYKKGKGFPDDEVQKVAEQIGGGSFQQLFDDYVRGVKELPLEEILSRAGLRLGPKKSAESPEEKDREATVSFGIRTVRGGETLRIAAVISGGPAYAAGLNAGDEILAFDGMRVSESNYLQRLQDFKPGDRLRVTLFRDNQLREFTLTLAPPPTVLEITPLENMSPLQKATQQSWLATPK